MLKDIHLSTQSMRAMPEKYRTEGGGDQLLGPESVRIAEAYAKRWKKSDAGKTWEHYRKTGTWENSAESRCVSAARSGNADDQKAMEGRCAASCVNPESRVSPADTAGASGTEDAAERRICDCDPEHLFPVGIEYTPPARGTWTIAHTPMLVPGLHEVYICPDGCLRGVVLSAEEFRGLDRFHVIEVREPDLYNGTLETKIIDGVTSVIQQTRRESGRLPSAVMVTTSCIHDLMGLDRDLVFRELSLRFPDIDIVPGWMNCTMRMSYLHYEQVQWRQNYAALHPCKKDPKSVNIIGSSFTLDRESELVQMLENGGYTVRDLTLCRTYEDYQKMASSTLNIWNWVMGMETCRDLEERLGQPSLHMPYPWTYKEIRKQLTELSQKTGTPLPDLDDLQISSNTSLQRALEQIGDTEIQIDGVAVMLPFQLAELLLDRGFHVTKVYADAVMPEDRAAFQRIAEKYPDVIVSAMVNFRLRVRQREDEARAESDHHRILAIGQRSAYFAGTPYWVDLIQNNGWYGFTGICRLSDAMIDAYGQPKDTATQIQIKARGCQA
jgi:hypothetical protein